MRKRVLVIDGYNVIHGSPELAGRLACGLEAGRTALIRHCAEWRQRRRDFAAVCIVFDGDSSVSGYGNDASGGVEVRYTATKEEADDRIRALIDGEFDGAECVVVTDDRPLADAVRSRGCGVMAVDEFCAALRGSRASAQRDRGDSSVKTGLAPEAVRRINDELRRRWGVAD